MAKSRYGFVTNSSSSNFILGFKDEDDYLKFKEYCKERNFKQVYKLVKRLRNNKYCKHDIESVKEHVIHYLARDIQEALYEKYEPEYKDMNYREKAGVSLRLWKDENFLNEIYNKLNEDVQTSKILTRLSACEILVQGCVWDNTDDSGLLEWAIRSDLLNTEFRRWCILNYHIG